MAVIKKKNTINLLFDNYNVMLIGEPKSGKTSLFFDVMLTKYGSTEAGAIIPLEVGYSHLNGANVLVTADDNDQAKPCVEDWDDFEEIVDDLIENRFTDYVGVKSVFIDTIDRLNKLAEAEIIRRSNKKGTRADSINKAFGGYGAGIVKQKELIDSTLRRLRMAGYGLWSAAHLKEKVIKKDETDEGYNALTSLMQEGLYKIYTQDCDFICMITNESEVVPEKGVIKHHRIRFVGDSYFALAGSRFAPFLPEYIDYSAANFLNTFDEAMQKASNLTPEQIKINIEAQMAAKQAAVKKFLDEDQTDKEKQKIETLVDDFNALRLSASEVIKNAIYKKVTTEGCQDIYGLITKLGYDVVKEMYDKCLEADKDMKK